jgi:histidyl-tRNA synthetase
MSLEGVEAVKPPLTVVAFAGKDVYSNALETVGKLRASGLRAEVMPQERPLGKQFEDASAMGARWVLVIGKKELSSGTVTLRDMRQRTESQLPFKDALELLSKAD